MDSNVTQISLYETLLCPADLVINEAYADRTALNSVAIITDERWQELVRSLIEQAHFRCNMPSYKTCITDMLRAHGFKPVHGDFGLGEIVNKLNDDTRSAKKYIVKLYAGAYYALVPDPVTRKYVLKGCRPHYRNLGRRKVDELWEYFPGTDNRTWITRSSTGKKRQKEASSLENKNLNPEGRSIGDCVVRALSGAYECTWHEAVDLLALTSDYNDPQINSTANINKTLTRLGFEMHSGIRSGRGFVNASQICPVFDRLYQNGERIFAYLGKHHCAAILPVESGGKTCYKIQDTWDSTSREVTEYWVLKRPGEEKKPEPEPDFPGYKIGTVINHPVYGKGIIKSHIVRDSGLTLEVHFEPVGTKYISAEWLRKNAPESNFK